MTPAKSIETQKDANEISTAVHKFWLQNENEYKEMIGPANVAAQDQIIQLNFADAAKRINDLAKQIKESTKPRTKRGSK